jgi:hypothetical protein
MGALKVHQALVVTQLWLIATHGFDAPLFRGDCCARRRPSVRPIRRARSSLHSRKGDWCEPYSLGLKPFIERKGEAPHSQTNHDVVLHSGGSNDKPHPETTASMMLDHNRTSSGVFPDAPAPILVNATERDTNVSQANPSGNQTLDATSPTSVGIVTLAASPNSTSATSATITLKSKGVNASSPKLKPKTTDSSHPWSSYLQGLNSIYQSTASSSSSHPSSSKNKNVSTAHVWSDSSVLLNSLSTAPLSTNGKIPIDAAATTATGGTAFELTKKKATDPLTLHDLENILLTKRFVREADLQYHLTSQPPSILPSRIGGGGVSGGSGAGRKSGTAADSSGSSSSSASKRIAFPQPALLNDKTFQWSCTIASGALCMLVATSVVPNLWLMGALVGGLYGNEVSKRQHVDEEGEDGGGSDAVERGPLENLALYLGRRLALAYLKVYDTFNAAFFMWKTGQLSYEYYKTYSSLDERFAIQRKIDAWNAFFVEGKIAFDRWERENEISRKILAGLRTAWLVEERSLKKSRRKRQSKYRIIQLVFDAEDFVRRFVRSVWKAVSGGGSNEFRDFLKGVRIDITDSQASMWGSRLGSVFAAVLAVNLTGALFAISPSLLSFLAILVGVVWPTWASEFYERLTLFAQEASARGRGDLKAVKRKVDKSKYHYFVRDDGSKRYYRVGRPWFEPQQPNDKRKKKDQKASDGGWDWGFLPWS